MAGDYWFSAHKGEFSYVYPNNINPHIEEVEKYYNDLAHDYENVMRSWGYYMPETVIDSLIRYGNLKMDKEYSVLDLGCGEGLCGYIAEVCSSCL